MKGGVDKARRTGTEIIMIRLDHIARPADEISEDAFWRIPNRSQFRALVDAPRNIDQLKMVHALLATIAQAHPGFATIEEIKRDLKRKSGMFREYIAKDGRVYYELESVSPALMDQTRFAEVWAAWKRIILEEILPGVTDRELEREIVERLTK